MNMKKVLSVMLVVVMTFCLTGCLNEAPAPTEAPTTAAPSKEAETTPAETEAPASEDLETEAPEAEAPAGAPTVTSTDKVEMIWSHNAAVTTANHRAALKLKEALEEYSNGNFTVTIYPNGELGSVVENDLALKEGTTHINAGTMGGLADPRLSYFDSPNMVDSNEQALEMMAPDTELYKYTADLYAELGLKLMSVVPVGYRETSSNKPVRSYEELAGLNIRTLENPYAIAYWETWGCNPTPVAFSELYIALQQGLVEAEENTYDTIVSSKLYEQQKYIINTHHVIMWNALLLNDAFYNSLPADYQELLNWVITEVYTPFVYEESLKANDAALQTMKDAGLEVIDLTEEDFAKMREAAQPAYDMIREAVGDKPMDLIAEAQKKAN